MWRRRLPSSLRQRRRRLADLRAGPVPSELPKLEPAPAAVRRHANSQLPDIVRPDLAAADMAPAASGPVARLAVPLAEPAPDRPSTATTAGHDAPCMLAGPPLVKQSREVRIALKPARAGVAAVPDALEPQAGRIDLEELSVRISGHNLALARLAGRLQAGGIWQFDALTVALGDLEDLSARRGDLTLYWDLISDEQRLAVGVLDSPAAAVSLLSARISAARGAARPARRRSHRGGPSAGRRVRRPLAPVGATGRQRREIILPGPCRARSAPHGPLGGGVGGYDQASLPAAPCAKLPCRTCSNRRATRFPLSRPACALAAHATRSESCPVRGGDHAARPAIGPGRRRHGQNPGGDLSHCRADPPAAPAPERILAVTFTNKAAAEMQAARGGPAGQAAAAQARDFHVSLAVRPRFCGVTPAGWAIRRNLPSTIGATRKAWPGRPCAKSRWPTPCCGPGDLLNHHQPLEMPVVRPDRPPSVAATDKEHLAAIGLSPLSKRPQGRWSRSISTICCCAPKSCSSVSPTFAGPKPAASPTC